MDIVEIYKRFPTEEDCIRHLENIRWNGKPACPYCRSQNTSPSPREQRHHCNNCNTTFSSTTGTFLHGTHLPLQKWFLAICLILRAEENISSRQLAQYLKVNKDTGWRISTKIGRFINQTDQATIFTGIADMCASDAVAKE